jgi:hypothetical protein
MTNGFHPVLGLIFLRFTNLQLLNRNHPVGVADASHVELQAIA